MIAEVVFDLPLRRPLSYSIPAELHLQPGQRVRAPLRGRSRVGIVVELREGNDAGLARIERPVESVPIVSAGGVELARWAAQESLSSLGSTLLSLLPPPARAIEVVAPPPESRSSPATPPELWVGARREERLANRLASGIGSALVIAPDRQAAERWAERVGGARLDSGAPEAARRAAWFAASRGRSRIVVGTRSALLAPLPPPATLALLDEHDPAHKPPGAPRLHSRDLLMRRASLEGSQLVMLSATPSVEIWWRTVNQEITRSPASDSESWPEVITADTRGILRNHPLTLPLTRTIEHTTRSGGRVALIVGRRGAALLCAECGAVARCPDCGVPLAFSRVEKTLACRLCARSEPAGDRCAQCGGHRLSPLGWDAERVEAAVRRRFPKLAVSRGDPRAQVLVGTPSILKPLGPGTLAAVGLVAMDSLLAVPDFRGGERAFELAWAAGEAVRPGGRLIIQTLHPDHYAIQAVRAHELGPFYDHELKLRAELGYPPFRRLCEISLSGRSETEARALALDCAAALHGIAGLTVYPPRRLDGGARRARWQLIVKGPDELPRLIGPPLTPFIERKRRAGGIVEVEMDPI